MPNTAECKILKSKTTFIILSRQYWNWLSRSNDLVGKYFRAYVQGFCFSLSQVRVEDEALLINSPSHSPLLLPWPASSVLHLEICSVDCGSHGVCMGGSCRCEEGWTGPACNQRACHPRCAEHGTCKDGKCECSQGWNGEHCTIGRPAPCPGPAPRPGHAPCPEYPNRAHKVLLFTLEKLF